MADDLRIELSVFGFLRELRSKIDVDIPKALILIIVMFHERMEIL